MASDVPAGDSFAEANKTYFNDIANRYDDLPHHLERARRIADVIIKNYNFDESTTTVMEYACGTGLISRELAQYAKRIVGVDISQGMVDQFNKRVENQGIPPEEMQAVCVELKGEPGELIDEKFDVIVCGSAYHHFPSVGDVTRTLTHFLKPGGFLLVVDLLKQTREQHTCGGHEQNHEHHVHGDDDAHQHVHHGQGDGNASDMLIPQHFHTLVPHRNGFTEDDIRRAFEGAGLASFTFKDAFSARERGMNVKLFLAIGMKPVMEV